MTPAERQRRYRARKRKGGAVLNVPVKDRNRFVTALLVSGVVSDAESRNRKNIESIAADIIEEYIKEIEKRCYA
jgi:hypothetical protein